VPDELDTAIQDAATEPEEATVDGVHVKQHSLPDQIAADRYLESKKASRAKGFRVRRTKVIPPGAV
jgi:hypothetical protein